MTKKSCFDKYYTCWNVLDFKDSKTRAS